MKSVQRLSPDGVVSAYSFPASGCCPIDLCEISEESLKCSFVGILPDGAMWSHWKRIAISGGDVPCGSVVKYAQYAGKFLSHMLDTSLWPSIRESSPETAVTTLDDWIERLRWVDCYGVCRNQEITKMSPFEIMGICEPEYCGVTYDDDFNIAYKSALVRALSRMNMGIVGNIDSINWVLEPLVAKIVPVWVGGHEENKCDHKNFCLKIEATSKEWGRPKLNCSDEFRRIPSYFDRGCDIPMGLHQYIWPSLLAAECIVRSLIPKKNVCIENPFCANPDEFD